MKKTKSILIFLLSIFIISCQTDFDEFDSKSGSSRLTLRNQNIGLVNNFGLKSDVQVNYAFTLVADVEAPSIDYNKLQATSVDIDGNFAYVSYNMRGSQNMGAIDIIDITNPRNPQIINTILFNNRDVNTLKVINGNIYFGGQYLGGAYTSMASTENTDDIEILSFSWGSHQKPYSVNSMDVSDVDGDNQDFSYIWFTAGDNGGLYILDPDDDGDGIITVFEIFDSRSVKALSNNEVYVLSGNDIHLWNGETLSDLDLIDGEWIQQYSKADLDANENYLFAAVNRGGLLVIDIENTPPTVSQRLERPHTPEGLNPEDFVTNSVSVNNDLLFIANGGAGIIVCEVTPNDDDDYDKSNLPFQELGYFDFGGPLSSNFVLSQDNYIFVATGLGGLKILTFEEIPPIEPGEFCETLQSSIINMFPEQEDATEAHPYLFNNSNELRVITNKETEVWVQFLWEGAGWTNTFGYYTYELGDEPQTTDDVEKNIIFTNASMVGSGGDLNQGDMVNLGVFPANTVVGFYLIAQGWDNETEQLTQGVYTHYTDFHLNENNQQQHLLFLEDCCNELVLTFEDIKLPSGDKDFNDIIFTIKDNNEGFENNPNSFKTEDVYFIPLCEDFNDTEWVNETAFVGSDLGDGVAWWYYFDNTVNVSHPIYAGQQLVEGASANYIDGVLTIELGPNMILQNGNETVKIQGYNEDELPSSRPAAGLFTTYKGNDLIIELDYYDYYVIHLDVSVIQ